MDKAYQSGVDIFAFKPSRTHSTSVNKAATAGLSARQIIRQYTRLEEWSVIPVALFQAL